MFWAQKVPFSGISGVESGYKKHDANTTENNAIIDIIEVLIILTFNIAFFAIISNNEPGENMKSLIIGIIVLAAAVFVALPPETAGFGLGWWTDVLTFLRGGLPVFAVLVGLIAIFIGIADMKDRAEAKKEQAEQSGD